MMKTHNKQNPIKPLLVAALAALALAGPSYVTAQDQAVPSSDQTSTNGQAGQRPHPEGGPHVLPPHASEKLNLTEDQKQQVANLEAEVKSKVETILTPDQLVQLKQLHARPERSGDQTPQPTP